MATRTRLTTVSVWVVTALLAALYLFSGSGKLSGAAMHVEHFTQWGYPNRFRLFVGGWEVVFALLLLVPRLSFYAAGGLALGMAGGVYTELFRGTPSRALFPLILLAILLGLARMRASERWR